MLSHGRSARTQPHCNTKKYNPKLEAVDPSVHWHGVYLTKTCWQGVQHLSQPAMPIGLIVCGSAAYLLSSGNICIYTPEYTPEV